MVRKLATECRQKPKGGTRGYCGSRKRVTVAGTMTSHRAKVVWFKRDIARKECTRDDVASRNQRGHTSGTRPWIGLECNNGIRGQGLNQKLQFRIRIKNPDARRQLHLRIEQTADGIDGTIFRLENAK
jgi:hypothetical protein